MAQAYVLVTTPNRMRYINVDLLHYSSYEFWYGAVGLCGSESRGTSGISLGAEGAEGAAKFVYIGYRGMKSSVRSCSLTSVSTNFSPMCVACSNVGGSLRKKAYIIKAPTDPSLGLTYGSCHSLEAYLQLLRPECLVSEVSIGPHSRDSQHSVPRV